MGCADGGQGAPPADPPQGSLLRDPLGALPSTLSGVGLYRDLSQLTASDAALAYAPGYPLWSDGGEKQRLLVLPEGASIDASDPEAYAFPAGTLLFKTFSYRTPASPDRPAPVETRLLRATDDGWEFAAYAWDDAGRDAELLDLRRSTTRTVLSETGETFEHGIPSRLECRQCHDSASSRVLGLSELQLAGSGDLRQLLPHLEPAPAKPYAALPEYGPLTTQVLGYLVGNCVSCHNGGNGAASSFDLRPNVALDSLIDQPTASSATADGIRVVPGDPDASVMYAAVAGGSDVEVKDMPPLGVALRDVDAIQLLSDWIVALGEGSEP